ncbi:hypothetical protein [Legionella cincinnatiensis]|uniref:BioF2-like acetyltransferase domain-containing protein n=1 Tax=Legionella cincinnatiensis TaxID=28085 RepID=A0A378IN95_9GAMM|nr:hypothetical protein [Legionella cincinnatiensis]KTC88560.1 hypothetical protein Lcin_1437 [Legionella cincinnatiensis]STX35951.1 Uncharacterised protein [Legionella cincinnatiensis]
MNFNEKSQKYSEPFIQGPTQKWMLNVESHMSSLNIGGFIFPVTVNNQEYHSSYVCSPYNALVTYGQDELFKIKNYPLRLVLNGLMKALGGFLRAVHINQNVCINNFYLSTNPYPDWKGEGAEDALKSLSVRYPHHAIMYRSLNEHTNKELIEHLRQLNFFFVASRQVYIFDNKLCLFKQRNNTQNDRRALAKGEFTLVTHEQISEQDYPVIVHLYNLLYLKKYSQHNPQFSERLIAYWHKNKLLTFFGLRDKKGVLQGIMGIFDSETVITAPLVGYNTHLPNQCALYRMLIYLVLDYTDKKSICLNLSSGASGFKRLRGGQPFIEYSAVYTKHLPLYRRIAWRIIQSLLNNLLISILKRYQL